MACWSTKATISVKCVKIEEKGNSTVSDVTFAHVVMCGIKRLYAMNFHFLIFITPLVISNINFKKLKFHLQ